MIDTHAHLNFPDFNDDRGEVIGDCFGKGIEKIIIPGSDVENSQKAVEITQEKENIFAAVGIHPHYTDEVKGFNLLERLAQNKKVVAIGECGLDYFRLENNIEKAKERQGELFLKHIELAKKEDLPLIFHNRESEEDFYKIVKDKNVRGVVHCFTSTLDFARKVLDLGFLISFTGIITFPKTEEILQVVKEVPLEKMMVETDSPLLAPVPYRGRRCEPWMEKEVIQKIAEIKEISSKEVEEKTSANARKFFDI